MRAAALAMSFALAGVLAGCSVALDEEQPDEEQPVASITQEVINNQLCGFIAERANGADHEMVLEQIRAAIVGRKNSVGLRDGKYIQVTDVRSLSLDGCRVHLRMGLRLRRPGIRADATGYADVSGTLYAAKQWRFEPVQPNTAPVWTLTDRACLRSMDTDNVTLSNTARIGQLIFERQADKKNGDCFSAGSLWVSVQNAIAEANALIDAINPFLAPEQQIGRVPLLTFEQLPDYAP